MRQLYLYCKNTNSDTNRDTVKNKNTMLFSHIGTCFSLQLLRIKLLQATINYISYIRQYFTPMNKIEEITRFIDILIRIKNNNISHNANNSIKYEYFKTHREYILNECSKYGILGLFFFINHNSYDGKHTINENYYIRKWLYLIIFHDNICVLEDYYDNLDCVGCVGCIHNKSHNHKYEIRPKLNTYHNFFLSEIIDYSIYNSKDIHYLL